MAIEWLQHIEKHHKHTDVPLPEYLFILYTAVSVWLVLIAGLMSGLTLGLMSLDAIDMEVGLTVGLCETMQLSW